MGPGSWAQGPGSLISPERDRRTDADGTSRRVIGRERRGGRNHDQTRRKRDVIEERDLSKLDRCAQDFQGGKGSGRTHGRAERRQAA